MLPTTLYELGLYGNFIWKENVGILRLSTTFENIECFSLFYLP